MFMISEGIKNSIFLQSVILYMTLDGDTPTECSDAHR